MTTRVRRGRRTISPEGTNIFCSFTLGLSPADRPMASSSSSLVHFPRRLTCSFPVPSLVMTIITTTMNGGWLASAQLLAILMPLPPKIRRNLELTANIDPSFHATWIFDGQDATLAQSSSHHAGNPWLAANPIGEIHRAALVWFTAILLIAPHFGRWIAILWTLGIYLLGDYYNLHWE